MKKVMLVLLGVVLGCTTCVIASNLMASNISYTPKDTSWGVNTVEAAIDSLKLSKTSDNYSTEEKVVGTWIDGKPIYQKTVLNFAIGTVILSDVDTIVEYDLLYKGANSSNYYLNSQGWSSESFIGVALNNGNISINKVGSAYSSGNMLHGTFKYTKTTDQATNN